MAKCVSARIEKGQIQDYAVMLKKIKNYDQKEESPEEVKKRLIDKINKANVK